MKNYVLIILVVVTLATVAAAAKEELYPAEYAPLFTEYRAVTPNEAVAAVVVSGDNPHHLSSGAKIYKPIAIKCLNGLPAEYIVLAYKGDDSDIIKAIECLTTELNKDGFFDPEEVAAALTVLKNKNEGLSSYMVSGWTWDGPITYAGMNGEPVRISLFLEFDYYGQIKKANSDIKGIRLYGSSPYCKRQIYCVKTSTGLKYYWTNRNLLIAVELSELKDIYNEDIGYYFNNYTESKQILDSNRDAWNRVLNVDIEEYRKGGNYFINRYPDDMDSSSHTHPINDVPDTNKLRSGDCWAVALSCCWAYWSEVNKISFPGVQWSGELPDITNHAQSEVYASRIAQEFEEYIDSFPGDEAFHLRKTYQPPPNDEGRRGGWVFNPFHVKIVLDNSGGPW